MGDSNPKISVIMPSYNGAKFIKQSLESVVNQSFEDIEIICVDAGSTDGTLDILKDYSTDSRVKILNSDVKSYGHQINMGIDNANGEYMGIVETDGCIHEKMYETLYGMTKKGQADIAKVNFYHYYDSQENPKFYISEIKKNVPTNEFFTVYDDADILNGHPSIWAAIYKKSFLTENNIKFMEASGWIDTPFLFETALLAKSIVYNHKPFYFYRELNHDSSTKNIKDLTLAMEMLNNTFDVMDNHSCNDEDILEMLYIHVFWHIRNILKSDNFDEQKDHVLKSFQNVLKRMDKEIVDDRFNKSTQKIYYKYCSPVNLIEFDNSLKLSYDDLIAIKNENEFLNSQIIDLKSDNKKLKSNNKSLKNKNKKLKSKNSKLKKSLKNIKQSRSYKLGNSFASPVRKLKKIKHNHNKSKRLKILFLPSDNNRTSGAFLSMTSLIVHLKEKYPVDVFVVVPMKGHGVDVLKSFGIDYKLIVSKDWVVPMDIEKDSDYYESIDKKREINKKAVKDIRKFIRDNNIDIVHLNTTWTYVGAIAGLEENVPVVWHLREFLEEGQNLTIWDRPKGNALINKSDKVITVSDILYKKYENIIDDDKLISIHDGIDAERFYNPTKTIFNDEKIKFILVGGFEYHKGQIEFIKACAKLYSSGFHNFEVSFVGTGNKEVKKFVESLVAYYDLDNVSFLGYKKDVENCFAESDISFTCGSIESFGRTTVEAMLCGNLVIGADSAGTKELIDDGVTGILYKQGDADDLYEKMLFAVNNLDKSKQMAQNGRKFMYENMTSEINADKVYEVYEEILKK